MLNVTHRHVFVSQKVCRHSSCSVRTRAWIRLVVNTLRGNMSVEHNIGNYETICIQARPFMRKFACGHVHVSQKVAQRDVFFTVNTHFSPSRGSNQWSVTSISYVKSCIHTRPPMWKFAPGDVLVSQNSANKRLLVKIAHCHVSQLIQLVETRRIRQSSGKLCWKLHTDMGSCVKICTRIWPCKSKSRVEARLFTVNTVLRISETNVHRHCFMCHQKLHRDAP